MDASLLNDAGVRRLAARLIVDAIIDYDRTFLRTSFCEVACSELSGEMRYTPDDIIDKMVELGMARMSRMERAAVLGDRAREVFGSVGGMTDEERVERMYDLRMSNVCVDCGQLISRRATRCHSCANREVGRRDN